MTNSSNIKKNRYPGIRSFEQDEANLFYGRADALDELFGLIQVKPLNVVFSKSGLGKTSLIKAGLCPLLEKEGYLPIFFRLQNTEVPPVQAVLEILENHTPEQRYTGKYANSNNQLWAAINQLKFGPSEKQVPVLIFDQFEELFHHKKSDQLALAAQLADLIEQRLPDDVQTQLESVSWRERRNDKALQKWISPAKVKVVMAIRSDRMSELHPLRRHIPTILHHRFELLPLSLREAQQAVALPAKLQDDQLATQPFTYAPETLTDILGNLSNEEGEIESFQLQIICQHIEQKVKVKQQQQSAELIVTPDYLGGSKGIANILKSYYSDQIATLGTAAEQLAVRKLLEEGLIADGRRIGVAAAVVKNNFQISDELLEKLMASRLIRPENTRLGTTYELSHDTLVAPILQAYEKRRLAEERQLAKQQLAAEQAKLAAERKKRRRAMLFGLAMLLLAAFALFQFIKANQERQKAEAAKEAAEIATMNEQSARAEADAQSAIAKQEAANARIEKDKAIAAESDAKAATREATRQRINAEEQYRIAETRYLMDQANRSRLAKNHYNALGHSHKALQIWKGNEIPSEQSIELYRSLTETLENFAVLSQGKNIPIFLKDISRYEHPVRAAAFSPDGKQMLVAAGTTVELRELDSDKTIRFQHDDNALSVGWSPDQEKILTAAGNRAILWDNQGNEVVSFNHNNVVNTVEFSPDGLQVLTAANDNKAVVWNLQGISVRELPHAGIVTSASFSPSGKAIMTTEPGVLRLWSDSTLVENITNLQVARFAPDFYENDGLLALSENHFVLLDYEPEKPVVYRNERDSHTDEFFTDFCFLHVGEFMEMVSASKDNTVKLWQPIMNDLATVLDLHQDQVNVVSVSPGDQFLISGSGKITNEANSADNSAKLWAFQPNPVVRLPHESPIQAIDISSDGKLLAIGSGRSVSVWNSVGEKLSEFRTPSKVTAIQFAPSEDRISISTEDQNLQLTDLQGQTYDIYPGAGILKRSHQGQHLFGIEDKYVQIWDGQMNKKVRLEHTSAVKGAAISRAENRILSWTQNNLKLWDISGRLLRTIPLNQAVQSAVLSPSGKYYLLRTDESNLEIWHINGKKMGSLNHQGARIRDAVFAPDERTVLTATGKAFEKDKNAVWNWSIRGRLNWQRSQNQAVYAASYSPDGTFIISRNAAGKAILYSKRGKLLGELPHASLEARFLVNNNQILTVDEKDTWLWPLPQQVYDWLEIHF